MKTKINILAIFCCFIAMAMFAPRQILAQPNYSFQQWCQSGGKTLFLSNLPSTTLVQQSFPNCTVSVYLSGTTTLATIYSDKTGTTLSNPFTANDDASFVFYAAPGVPYDVTISGGGLPAPWTFVDICLACVSGSGSGTVTNFSSGDLPPIFTTSVANSTTTPTLSFHLSTADTFRFLGNFTTDPALPSYWHLVAGSNITLSSNGTDTLTISASGGGGGGCTGTLPGDNTSTDCGFGNQVANTGTSISTFGYTNVTGSNTASKITAVGTGNVNTTFGSGSGYVVAVGDANVLNSTPVANAEVLIGIGRANLNAMNSGSAVDIIGIGEDNASSISGFGSSEVIGIGDSNASCLVGGSSEIVALGDGSGNQKCGAGLTGEVFGLVAIGDSAAQNLGQSVSDVIAIGDGPAQALANNSFDIIAIGDGTDKQCNNPTSCIAGGGSLPNPVATSDVILIGDSTGTFNAGSNIVGIGVNVLGTNAVGAGIGVYNQGSYITAIGPKALVANTTGNNNTAIGGFAGSHGYTGGTTFGNSNKTGSNNTWIGYDSGPHVNTQLSNTIALGYQAANTLNNQAVIGNSSIVNTVLNGTIFINGAAPTSDVGTVTGTNSDGQVASLSAATSVTLTFANSGWQNFASCVGNTSSAGNVVSIGSIGPTTVTFNFPALTGTLYYHCGGN